MPSLSPPIIIRFRRNRLRDRVHAPSVVESHDTAVAGAAHGGEAVVEHDDRAGRSFHNVWRRELGCEGTIFCALLTNGR